MLKVSSVLFAVGVEDGHQVEVAVVFAVHGDAQLAEIDGERDLAAGRIERIPRGEAGRSVAAWLFRNVVN